MTSLPEPVSTPCVEEWCHTNVLVNRVSYKWTIQRFSWCNQPSGEFIESKNFPANATEFQPCWNLRVYPRGNDTNYQKYVRVGVYSNRQSAVYVSMRVSVVSGIEDNTKVEKTAVTFDTDNRFRLCEIYLDRSTVLNKACGFLQEDTLTILCEISYADKTVHIAGQSNFLSMQSSMVNLCKDFGNLLAIKNMCDVVLLSADGRELKAHKIILISRSKVFAGIFGHESKEKISSQITISDIDYDVLKNMLHYMYTSTAPNLGSMATELFVAADKYALDDLKNMCEESLIRCISVETAIDTLKLADRHSSENLKENAMAFIAQNISDIMATPGWNDLELYPHLLLDMVKHLIMPQ